MNTNFLRFTAQKFNKWNSELWHFIYPINCVICSTEVVSYQTPVCPVCLSELHYSYLELERDASTLDKLFWGRVQLNGTYALLNYSEKTSTQAILHAFKYKNQPQLGHYFGTQIGSILHQIEGFQDVDALLPVPLHSKKQFERGYNQAEELARGIQRSFLCGIRNDLLQRSTYTDSQTKRSRLSRWENMQNRFEVKQTNQEIPKHILLVDDVITTGATLESIVLELQRDFPTAKCSVVSLARAV